MFPKSQSHFYVLITILCLNTHFAAATHSTILLLKGPSSAGKTSVINAFMRIKPELRYVNEDEHCMDGFNLFLQQEFATEYKELTTAIIPENIFNAVTRNELVFTSDSTAEQKEKVIKTLELLRTKLEEPDRDDLKETYKKIVEESIQKALQSYIQDNRCILLDGWMISPKQVDELRQKAVVITLFFHCPLSTLLKRLSERNNMLITTQLP